MSTLSLTLTDGRKDFEPGEEIEFAAQWELDEPTEAIELRAVWRTSGKGETDVGTAGMLRFDHPSPVETRRMKLRLPDAPYSFSGQLVSLSWRLELVALPSEAFDHCEITIAPAGREVLLGEVASDDQDVANPKPRAKFSWETGR